MKYAEWRVKALLQKALSGLPYGSAVNYWLQRHVTHGFPISDSLLQSHLALARRHVDNYRRFSGQDPGGATFYEFGGGWDMAMPLMLRSLGISHQIVVDVKPLARLDLISDMLDRVERSVGTGPPGARSEVLGRLGTVGERLSPFGIDYRAPLDARRTGMAAGRVHCVTSTNTLEHIPAGDIRLLLKECHRILRDDGVASFQIDYNDHYSYFNTDLPHFHFLRYSDTSWRRFNSSLHFQSRLRHSEHVRLINDCGFQIVEEAVEPGSDEELDALARFPLADRFQSFDPADLVAHSAVLVLRKA